jgi:hypothetical protein
MTRNAMHWNLAFTQGDMHQPLHTVVDVRGSNDIAVEVK